MAIRKDDMMQVSAMAGEVAARDESDAEVSLWIPLNRLKDSPKNVRLLPHTQEHIKTLAALIQADRQLYPLIVEPERNACGEATGDYEVLAGKGRRLAQLERVKHGLIPADHPIWCVLGDTAHARETSLADNTQAPMHPADQFAAFKALLDEGKTLEEVAARFCVSPAVVHQRLKLANVAPEFLDLFRRGQLQLDHMKAFALTDDHEAQRAAWASLPKGDRPAHWIRQALLKDELPLSSSLAKFVGIAAYQKAGGAVRRDLFQTDDTYIVDTALLTQLATAKLERAAARLKKEGYAWVEPRLHTDYADLRAFGRVQTVVREATEAEATRLQAIAHEREELQMQASALGEEDEPLPELIERIEALQAESEAIATACYEPDPEQQRVAGAIVTVEHGKLRIERGLLRAEDQRRFVKQRRAAAKAADGGQSSRQRRHPARLVRELTAHKTLALQALLASRPDVAVIALTHRLATMTFEGAAPSAVQISAKVTDLKCYAQDIKEARAFKALRACERTLKTALPRKPEAWLDWLLKQPRKQVLALLAYCVAVTLDGVQAHEEAGPADALARAVGLDMREWWSATARNYLSRVPKDRVIDVVREAVSPEATAGMRDMKKAALAALAEKRIDGKGWLPAVLRTAEA